MRGWEVIVRPDQFDEVLEACRDFGRRGGELVARDWGVWRRGGHWEPMERRACALGAFITGLAAYPDEGPLGAACHALGASPEQIDDFMSGFDRLMKAGVYAWPEWYTAGARMRAHLVMEGLLRVT
jgi:hypothetical protein